MKNFKIFLLNILFIAVVFCTGAANQEKINFNGVDYYLDYSSKGNSGGYFNEYTKQGQTVKNWNEMIVIHNFPNTESPMTEVRKMGAFITALYAKNSPEIKNLPVAISYNEKTDAAILDFVIPVPDNKETGMEFNAFKYEKAKTKKGLIVFQYSKKYSSAQMKQKEAFQEDLVKTRKTILPQMAEVSIPDVIEKDLK